jgi:hypothetical protein
MLKKDDGKDIKSKVFPEFVPSNRKSYKQAMVSITKERILGWV